MSLQQRRPLYKNIPQQNGENWVTSVTFLCAEDNAELCENCDEFTRLKKALSSLLQESHVRKCSSSPSSTLMFSPGCYSYSEKGIAKHIPFSGLGLIPVYWSEVRCRGDEENILFCEKDIWQDGTCPQKLAAAVTCSSSLGKENTCGLVNSLPYLNTSINNYSLLN